jgi:hypothetical protein
VQKATAFKAKNPLGSKRYSPQANAAGIDDVTQLLDERALASDLSALITSGLKGLADIDAGGKYLLNNTEITSSISEHDALMLLPFPTIDVNNVLSALIARKRQMLLEEKGIEAQILKEFLLKVKKQKQEVRSIDCKCID